VIKVYYRNPSLNDSIPSICSKSPEGATTMELRSSRRFMTSFKKTIYVKFVSCTG
jgi:hypothetical protein